MATISIADKDAREQYTQSLNGKDNDPSPSATELSIDFPYISLDDIKVIKTTAAGVDTTLSRGTGAGTFTVTGTAVDDGFSGGNVKINDTDTTATTRYTIFRDIAIVRTTDFPTSGPFNISALNTELDRLFAISQELETGVSRTMILAESDSAASITLPDTSVRKNKILSGNTIKFTSKENEMLYHFSMKQLKSKHYDFFIFGHRHLPLKIELDNNSYYYNTGDWIKHYSFLHFKDDSLELKYFKN